MSRDARTGGDARDARTIRVALADDQDLVRAGLRAILEAEDDIEVVAEAATAPPLRRPSPREPMLR